MIIFISWFNFLNFKRGVKIDINKKNNPKKPKILFLKNNKDDKNKEKSFNKNFK